MEVLKVSARSNPNSVAGALAGVLREKGGAEIQAIGAGALNQAVKAIAIARGFVAPGGIDLVSVPAFTDIEIEGEERTAIKGLDDRPGEKGKNMNEESLRLRRGPNRGARLFFFSPSLPSSLADGVSLLYNFLVDRRHWKKWNS